MTRLMVGVVALTVALGPGLARAQSPSDDCTSGPVVQITTLPFYASGTMAWDDTVNFGTDIGAACAAGVGGTPTYQSGDFVYSITLGVGHHVVCSFTSDIPLNSADWVFVLSRSCESPLADSYCVWGQVVPELTSASFDTYALGLAPGTYYLWFDQEFCCPAWQVTCTGELAPDPVFADGFDSGNTSQWSSTFPPP